MWDKDPASFIDDVVLKDGAKHIKNIATDMLNGVVDIAAIDTTNFVGNTNVNIGYPSHVYAEGKTIGRAGARAAGQAVINKLGDKEMKNIYITNMTPYGQYLEGLHGKPHSRQSPNGIFRITFEAVSMWYR